MYVSLSCPILCTVFILNPMYHLAQQQTLLLLPNGQFMQFCICGHITGRMLKMLARVAHALCHVSWSLHTVPAVIFLITAGKGVINDKVGGFLTDREMNTD